MQMSACLCRRSLLRASLPLRKPVVSSSCFRRELQCRRFSGADKGSSKSNVFYYSSDTTKTDGEEKSSELSLSPEFLDACYEHLGNGYVKQLAFEKHCADLKLEEWELDSEWLVEWQTEGGGKRKADATHFLGTHHVADDNWLWVWANSGVQVPRTNQLHSQQLREDIGERLKVGEFKRAVVRKCPLWIGEVLSLIGLSLLDPSATCGYIRCPVNASRRLALYFLVEYKPDIADISEEDVGVEHSTADGSVEKDMKEIEKLSATIQSVLDSSALGPMLLDHRRLIKCYLHRTNTTFIENSDTHSLQIDGKLEALFSDNGFLDKMRVPEIEDDSISADSK